MELLYISFFPQFKTTNFNNVQFCVQIQLRNRLYLFYFFFLIWFFANKQIWTSFEYFIWFCNFLLLSSCVAYHTIAKFQTLDTQKYLILIIIGGVILMSNLPYCVDFFQLFIIIEGLGCLYFFFFLNCTTLHTTPLKLKNIYVFYLWTVFWTALIYGLGLGLLFLHYGTINFYELSLLIFTKFEISLFLIVLSVFLKTALPGFHFLKAKVYLWLNSDVLIFFFIITLIFNLNLLCFFLFHTLEYILNVFLILGFCIFIFSLYIYCFISVATLFEFFFISSLVTVLIACLILL